MSRTAKKLLIAAGSALVFAGLLETGLRIKGFVHYPLRVRMVIWNANEDQTLQDGESLHRPSPRQLWEPRPDVPLPWGQDERINRSGYRGTALARRKAPGAVRIATLGDSSTFGMFVADAETYSRRLEDALATDGAPVEVLNAGVIGFTIEQGLERYDRLVRAHTPDVVIAAFGAINDHLQAQGPADREKIERHASANNAWTRTLDFARYNIRVFHLAGFVVDRLRKEDRMAVARELKRIRQEKRKLAETMGQREWTGIRRVPLARFRECLVELASKVRADGGELVLVSMPRHPAKEEEAPVLADYNAAVAAVAAELGLPLFDARARIEAELAAGREWDELFVDYYHPSPTGHALFAAELAPLIAPLVADEDRDD